MANKKRPRICRACSKLIGSENTSCPYCGRRESPFDGLFDGLFAQVEFARIFLFANIVLFVLVEALSRGRGDSTFELLYRFGLLDPRAVSQGELFRLVNPIFLHLGLMHILFNGFALFSLGPDVESGYGREKFVLIYMIAGILGNVGSTLCGVGGGGASGALFGLVGAYVAFGMRSRQPEVTKRAVGWAVTLFLIGFVMGSRINHYAHFFGFVGGLGTAYGLGYREAVSFTAKRLLRGGAVALLLLVPVCFAWALVVGFA